MEYIEIDKKIFVQLFRYEDIGEFSKICERFREDNYLAIKKIWNSGIEVSLIYKSFLGIISNNIGFISTINCGQLCDNEKSIITLLGIPEKYNGIFINDMRMSIPYRHKGIGAKVVTKLLRNDKTYLLEPIEDGKIFWKKFGFKEMDKLAIREKVD